MRNVLIVVQARMGSSRLPGKVLLPFGGDTVLGTILHRLAGLPVVVATTQARQDYPILEVARRAGVNCVRSVYDQDVLARFVEVVALWPSVSTIVRITADCPFVDPALIQQVVTRLREETASYVSLVTATADEVVSGPRYPDGCDVEAMQSEALLRCAAWASDRFHREHVTPYFFTSGRTWPGRLGPYLSDTGFWCVHDPPLADWSDVRMTLDTPADYARLSACVEAVGREASWVRAAEWLRAHS